MRFKLEVDKRGLWWLKRPGPTARSPWIKQSTGMVDKALADAYARDVSAGGDGGIANEWKDCAYRMSDIVRQRNFQGSAVGKLPATDILKIFQRQEYKCAVSDLPLRPVNAVKDEVSNPWAPSLDRVVPGGPYQIDNVRIVCFIVNYAMRDWGEHPLWALAEKMALKRGLAYVDKDPLFNGVST